jgi:hypothetical protein
MTKATSMDYFDRLLARALSIPSGTGTAQFDDTFERYAPLVFDIPDVPAAVPATQPVDLLTPATVAPIMQAMSPQANTASIMPAPVTAGPAAPARADHAGDRLPAVSKVTLQSEPLPKQAYLNQDDLMSTADAFIEGLFAPHPASVQGSVRAADTPAMLAPAGQSHSEPAPKLAARATLGIRKAPRTPGLSMAPKATQIPALLQPPVPVPVSAAKEKTPAPAVPSESEQQRAAAQSESVAWQASQAPPRQTHMTVLQGKSTVTQHAHQLGATARFGISQL